MAEIEWLTRRFPPDVLDPGAVPTPEQLRRLVATTRPADECRRLEAEIAAVRAGGGPWTAEQAEYLVYSLRDFNANDYERHETSPLQTLTEIGDVGLAALIEHVDDHVPTRCVEFHSFTADYCVVPISFHCQSLLDADFRDALSAVERPAFDDPPAKFAAYKSQLRAALLHRNLKPSRLQEF